MTTKKKNQNISILCVCGFEKSEYNNDNNHDDDDDEHDNKDMSHA